MIFPPKVCEAIFTVYERSSVMRRRYLLEMKQRKQLHNQLVELKGNIRVLCRVRPLISEDGSGMFIVLLKLNLHVHADFDPKGDLTSSCLQLLILLRSSCCPWNCICCYICISKTAHGMVLEKSYIQFGTKCRIIFD